MCRILLESRRTIIELCGKSALKRELRWQKANDTKKNDRKYKEYKKYIRKKGSGSRGKTLLKAHQQLTCWGVDEASGKVRQPRPAIKRKQQLKNDFIN